MKLIKPKFWGGKIGIISILLFPLSLIFIFLVLLKKLLIKPKEFKIPIICVGNVYIGGTGKTPISIFLANELKLIGKKPVILRKYYKIFLTRVVKFRLDLDTFHDCMQVLKVAFFQKV